MRHSIKIVAGIAAHEWRCFARSPIWAVGLAGAAWFMFAEGSSAAGWPPGNTALYGFQLTSSVVLGVVAFLLAAGSLCRDLDDAAAQLIFSRPTPPPLLLAGKYLGGAGFMGAVVCALLVASLLRPLLHGVGVVYPPGPFLLVLVLCIVPMLAYTISLAVLLACLTRRVIVALPLYLVYFFWAFFPPTHAEDHVELLDFTMRLYPRELLIESPVRLADYSFQHLLDPVHPDLLTRCILHLGLSLLLLITSAWVLSRRAAGRLAPRPAIFSRRSRLAGLAAGGLP